MNNPPQDGRVMKCACHFIKAVGKFRSEQIIAEARVSLAGVRNPVRQNPPGFFIAEFYWREAGVHH